MSHHSGAVDNSNSILVPAHIERDLAIEGLAEFEHYSGTRR